MSSGHRTVFLSYASEDGGAARRIAETLRTAGIEVWFDQSELRGGDAWDQKIRRQIRECTLFMPVISAQTQARLEGYFRREWRMAVDRMHDMDDAMPFLVPVVVDDTPDARARVPERFKERQWMRAPGGTADPVFVEHIAGLFAGRADIPAAPVAPTGVRLPPTGKSHGVPGWLIAVLVLTGAGTGAYFSLIKPMLDHRGGDASPESRAATITDERPYYIGSVAVLPPHIPAPSSDVTAFADGLQDEILTEFSRMRSLDVVSRTSTLQYRDATEGMRAIGRALGADFVVEGSIQKDDRRWRVTLQLIEAENDRHLWAKTFDREADPDESELVFRRELAWELAIHVYRALRDARPPSPEIRRRLDEVVGRLATEAKEMEQLFWGNTGQPRDFSLYEPLLDLEREIVAVEPDNAAAHTSIALFLGQGPAAGKAGFLDPHWNEELLLALKRSLFVNPDHYDPPRNLGTYYLYNRGNPARALPHLQRALRLYEAQPDKPHNWPYYALAHALTATGQPAAALRVLGRVPYPPTPAEFEYWLNAFAFSRRHADAISFIDQHADAVAARNDPGTTLAIAVRRMELEVEWTGSREPIRKLYDQLDEFPAATPGLRGRLKYALGDYAGSLEEFAAIDPGNDRFAPILFDLLVYRGLAFFHAGNVELARSYFEGVLAEIGSGQQSAHYRRIAPGRSHAGVALMHALCGNEKESDAAIARANASIDVARNYEDYLITKRLLATAYVQSGRTAEACTTIDPLLSGPTGLSVGGFLGDAFFDQLRGSPEYEAVIREHRDQLKDPAILDTYFARPGGPAENAIVPASGER